MLVRLLKYCPLLLLGGALFGASSESNAVQEFRLALDQLNRQIHSQGVEMNLFQERATSLESSMQSLKQELKVSSSDKALEKRLLALEKAQEALTGDLKTLKNHINETNTSIAECQLQLNKIDKQLTSDIQGVKSSMQSMLALLQGEARSYTVKGGDSLGQIAVEHKTDVKTLKKLNNLTSDTIYSGQKLILP